MRHLELKVAAWLVGIYSALWALLAILHATDRLSDQDPTFLLVLLVYFLSWPVLQLLRPLGGADHELLVFLLGCAQWCLVGGASTFLCQKALNSSVAAPPSNGSQCGPPGQGGP